MVLRFINFKYFSPIPEMHNSKENAFPMEAEGKSKPKETRAIPPMNKEKSFNLCAAGSAITWQIMAPKDGQETYTPEAMAQKMHFWLFGKMNKCLKETGLG